VLAVTKLKAWAADLRNELAALQHALRDPRAGWLARALGICAIAYALSPVDLIPDFIPVLGLIDDLLIVPILLVGAIRALPPGLLEEYRRKILSATSERNVEPDEPRPRTASGPFPGAPSLRWIGLALVVMTWGALAAAAWWMLAG